MDKHYKRGIEHMQGLRWQKAANSFEQQLKEHKFKECWLNLGMCYKHLNQYDLSTAALLQAVHDTTPFFSGATGCYALGLHNLGCVAYALGDDNSAEAYYSLALECDPDRVNSVFSKSLPMLRKLCSNLPLDSVEGWQHYAARFHTTQPVLCDNGGIPLWNMINSYKRCVVLREQGYGDQLHFARYLPQLKYYFSEVVLESLGGLDVLFKGYEVCHSAADSRADVAVPIGSLAQKFGIDECGHWLSTQPQPLKTREFSSDKLNIGIEWSGSKKHSNDHNRSCDPALFRELRRPDVQLYSIRPNAEPQAGVVALNAQSWQESCEIVRGLDLIISVDTSLVHLAGCLDKPCWLLQPLYETDWRWGSDRMGTKNIWYRSVEVIRNPHNWGVVFEKVINQLDQLLTKKKYKMINQQLQNMLESMKC